MIKCIQKVGYKVGFRALVVGGVDIKRTKDKRTVQQKAVIF